MDNNYNIKINLREGIFEVSGSDKEWVREIEQEALSEFLAIAKERINTELPSKQITYSSQKTAGEAGADLAQNIKNTGKKTTHKKSARNPELENKLTAETQSRFNEFIAERRIAFDKSQPGQAAIIAYFLREELKWEGVDHNDLYTVYSLMGWRIPGNITAQLNNAMARSRFFSGITAGKYRLSNTGENFARLELKGLSSNRG